MKIGKFEIMHMYVCMTSFITDCVAEERNYI